MGKLSYNCAVKFNGSLSSLFLFLFFFLYFGKFEKRQNRNTEMIFATSVIAVLMSSALVDGLSCYGYTGQPQDCGETAEGFKYLCRVETVEGKNYEGNTKSSTCLITKNGKGITRFDQSGFKLNDLIKGMKHCTS